PWERGKCGYKIVQYMAVGRPAVGSAVGPNRSIIQPGKTGYLANSPEDWVSILTVLANDHKHIRILGLAARQRAESVYSLQANISKVVDVLKYAAREHRSEHAAIGLTPGPNLFAQARPESTYKSTPAE